MIFAVVIISAILMALFVAVTIAGGKSHDRQNQEAARRSAQSPADDLAGKD